MIKIIITITTGRTIAVTVIGVYSSFGSILDFLHEIGAQRDRYMYSIIKYQQNINYIDLIQNRTRPRESNASLLSDCEMS